MSHITRPAQTGTPAQGERTPRHKRRYSRYVVLSQETSAQLANATELTATDYRVLHIALARMNDHGHANFGSGELLRTLGISRMTLYRAKVKLHKAGLLTDKDGGESCIWVSSQLAFREGAGKTCQFHK